MRRCRERSGKRERKRERTRESAREGWPRDGVSTVALHRWLWCFELERGVLKNQHDGCTKACDKGGDEELLWPIGVLLCLQNSVAKLALRVFRNAFQRTNINEEFQVADFLEGCCNELDVTRTGTSWWCFGCEFEGNGVERVQELQAKQEQQHTLRVTAGSLAEMRDI